MELIEIERDLAEALAYAATADWAAELIKARSPEGSPWPIPYIEQQLRYHHRRWLAARRR